MTTLQYDSRFLIFSFLNTDAPYRFLNSEIIKNSLCVVREVTLQWLEPKRKKSQVKTTMNKPETHWKPMRSNVHSTTEHDLCIDLTEKKRIRIMARSWARVNWNNVNRIIKRQKKKKKVKIIITIKTNLTICTCSQFHGNYKHKNHNPSRYSSVQKERKTEEIAHFLNHIC